MAVKRASAKASSAATPTSGPAPPGSNSSATPTPAPSSDDAGFVWTAELEFLLFQACLMHKPAGPVKHFQMALIHRQMVLDSGGKENITPKDIWDKIALYYHQDECDALELSGLAEEKEEFSLPREQFGTLIAEMKRNGEIEDNDDEEEDDAGSTVSTEKERGKKDKDVESTPKGSEGKSKRPTRSTPGATPAKRRK